ncbi:transposase [Candidatus Woesearchaeota archaeon]|nr:transposase [Candidatus Woesearchaeota archaeon]
MPIRSKRIRKSVADFVNKAFVSSRNNSISKERLSYLLKASSNTYVETLCNKADGLHYHLNKTYPEVLSEEFFKQNRNKIKKLRLGTVDLIADITEENFYGKHSGLYVHGWTGEKGIKGKFRFLVVAILFRNKIIPFYISILPIGCFKAEYLGEAIEWFSSLGIKAKKIILDRGFYSGDIINTLKLKKINYLIFVPRRELYKCMLESVQNEGIIIEHEIKYAKDKSTFLAETDIALVKEMLGYDWVFATDIFLKDVQKYVYLYKKRWNIETMFRVHDEARIKSKSVKATTRLFYFLISMLLLLLWNLYLKCQITFKYFVIRIYEEYFCEEILGIDCIF